MKLKLNDLLRKVFEQKGLTLNSAAMHMGVAAGSLKGWVNYNKYPADVLEKIVELGWVASDQLKAATYELAQPRRKPALIDKVAVEKNTTLKQMFNQIESFGDRMAAQQDEFEAIVGNLFSSLSKNDEFVFVTLNEIPIEWQLDGWGKAKAGIKNAIEKKARIIYAVPRNDELIELKVKKTFTGFGIVEGEFQQLFNDFIDRAAKEFGKSTEEIRNLISWKETGVGFFHTPETKTAFFRMAASHETSAFISYRRGTKWIQVPFDHSLCSKLMRWLVKENCIKP